MISKDHFLYICDSCRSIRKGKEIPCIVLMRNEGQSADRRRGHGHLHTVRCLPEILLKLPSIELNLKRRKVLLLYYLC